MDLDENLKYDGEGGPDTKDLKWYYASPGEPIRFDGPGPGGPDSAPYEIVIFSADKDRATGYLATPNK